VGAALGSFQFSSSARRKKKKEAIRGGISKGGRKKGKAALCMLELTDLRGWEERGDNDEGGGGGEGEKKYQVNPEGGGRGGGEVWGRTSFPFSLSARRKSLEKAPTAARRQRTKERGKERLCWRFPGAHSSAQKKAA